MRYLAGIFLIAGLGFGQAAKGTKAAAPAGTLKSVPLTEVQVLTLKNQTLEFQVAQSTMQQAQQAFNNAQERTAALQRENEASISKICESAGIERTRCAIDLTSAAPAAKETPPAPASPAAK